MTKEEFRSSLMYVPPQFADFIINNADRILHENGFSEAEVESRVSAFLDKCSLLLNQFRFDKLHDAIIAFASELHQLRGDLNARERGRDQFLSLRQQGWSSAEIEFVERSLQKHERVERVDRKNCHLSSGRDLNRQALREAFRPPMWSNIQSWNSQFPLLND